MDSALKKKLAIGIVVVLVLGLLVILAHHNLGWFGGAIKDQEKKRMGGVCVCGKEPSWLFGCYFACMGEEEMEPRPITGEIPPSLSGCGCDGNNPHWLFGCLRCAWS